MQKSTQTRIKIIGRLPNTDEWVPIDEDESAQEEIPGVVRSSLCGLYRHLYVAGSEDPRVAVFRQHRPAERTITKGELLYSHGLYLTSQLELYGAQKSHPSDAPRRESAKAVILHMGDVSWSAMLMTTSEIRSGKLTSRWKI